MTFKVTGRIDKQLWTNHESWLYKISERIGDRDKSWTIFTKQELFVDQIMEFSGVVTESKDKKVNDQNGKPIYRTSFNADQINDPADQPPLPTNTDPDSFPF